MVLDPFIALAAAGNITQFVEYALQIVCKGRKIRADGALVEHEDIAFVSEYLSKLSTKLEESILAASGSQPLDDEEKHLIDLCRRCSGVAGEMLQVMRKLMGDRKVGMLKSLRQAFKAVWSQEKVEELTKRLQLLRNELNIQVLVALR